MGTEFLVEGPDGEAILSSKVKPTPQPRKTQDTKPAVTALDINERLDVLLELLERAIESRPQQRRPSQSHDSQDLVREVTRIRDSVRAPFHSLFQQGPFPAGTAARELSDRDVLPGLGLPETPLLVLGLSVRSGFR